MENQFGPHKATQKAGPNAHPEEKVTTNKIADGLSRMPTEKSSKVSLKRALVSVSDKTNLEVICSDLHSRGVEIISTGGTFAYLKQHQIPVTPIEAITGNPEVFDGRMKTISFQIGSSLLFRRDHAQDQQDASRLGIKAIDLVICNLYPFSQKAAESAPLKDLIENIDIGGPTMVRAAAKNYQFVTVLTKVEQYQGFMEHLQQHQGQVTLEQRERYALAAFRISADYEQRIFQTLQERWKDDGHNQQKAVLFPDFRVDEERSYELRYGENPHQKAVFYPFLQHQRTIDQAAEIGTGVGQAQILQGKTLSYNNYLDADAAWKCASDAYWAYKKLAHHPHPHPFAVSIIKHLNPCGVAVGDNPLEVLKKAWESDPVSSFGSIICFTRPPTMDCLDWLKDKFVEVILLPPGEGGEVDPSLLAALSSKKNLRVLALPVRAEMPGEVVVRSISGGLLVQDEDEGLDPEWLNVSVRPFPSDKIPLAQFGLMVTKHLKSNAIGLFHEDKTNRIFHLLSAGMGQPNRVDALKELAIPKARKRLNDLSEVVCVSDAFFPFPDTVEVAAQEGLRHLVQPGGSMRDSEVVAAANRLGISMVFTHRRHFRH